MKLIEGTYENLITDGLMQDMQDASANGLVCRQEDIDGAESPNMLTEHLSRIIRNRLSDENLTAEERALFVNRLIDYLGESKEEKVMDDKKMQGSVAGVFNIEELNTELFFVTLNKSDKDFSAETMYNDYVVSENEFRWESQNTDSHQGKGRRFVEQKSNGKKFLLFVRENKKDGYGNTCPFICFGLVDYISSKEDKPMKINWQTHQPILPQFLNAV